LSFGPFLILGQPDQTGSPEMKKTNNSYNTYWVDAEGSPSAALASALIFPCETLVALDKEEASRRSLLEKTPLKDAFLDHLFDPWVSIGSFLDNVSLQALRSACHYTKSMANMIKLREPVVLGARAAVTKTDHLSMLLARPMSHLRIDAEFMHKATFMNTFVLSRHQLARQCETVTLPYSKNHEPVCLEEDANNEGGDNGTPQDAMSLEDQVLFLAEQFKLDAGNLSQVFKLLVEQGVKRSAPFALIPYLLISWLPSTTLTTLNVGVLGDPFTIRAWGPPLQAAFCANSSIVNLDILGSPFWLDLVLQRNKPLQSLHVRMSHGDSFRDPPAIKELATLLASQASTLKRFVLTYGGYTDEDENLWDEPTDIALLVDAISGLKVLEHLEFRTRPGNVANEWFAEQVIPGAVFKNCLKSFSIAGLPYLDNSIVKFLANCPKLETLFIEDVDIEDQDFFPLVIGKCTTLHHLRLDNGSTQEDLVDILTAVHANKNVVTVELGSHEQSHLFLKPALHSWLVNSMKERIKMGKPLYVVPCSVGPCQTSQTYKASEPKENLEVLHRLMKHILPLTTKPPVS
jgi:hypothetical protein